MNIGDIVTIKPREELPAEILTTRVTSLCGLEAEIIDRLFSETEETYLYRVRLTGAKTVPLALFPEEALDLVVVEPVEYEHEIEVLDNVVVARFYEVRGGERTEIAKGHGHIIHDGAYGIAQATSYAMKRIYQSMGGGA
jgi:hypothetical protein